MPRYFFHADDLSDDDGLVLQDDEQACDEALRAAGSIISDLRDRMRNEGKWQMRVLRSDGKIIAEVEFSVRRS